MFADKHNSIGEHSEKVYREESMRIPMAVTLALIILIAAPLVYWVLRINQEGSAAANVSEYEAMVEMVDSNVKTVTAMLRNDSEAMEAIRESRRKPVVTLVVPEVLIVEERINEPVGPPPLEVELEGIFWSPTNPVATLDGETYSVGEKVEGYEIIYIGKSKVQFRYKDGTVVVKDMYEDLLKNQR